MKKLSGGVFTRLVLAAAIVAGLTVAAPPGIVDAAPVCDTNYTGLSTVDPTDFTDADNWDAGVPDSEPGEVPHGCIEGTHDVELASSRIIGGLTIGEDASLTVTSSPTVMIGELLNHGLLATTGDGPAIHIVHTETLLPGTFTNHGTVSFTATETYLYLDGTFTNAPDGTVIVGGDGFRGLNVSNYYHVGEPAILNQGSIVVENVMDVSGRFRTTLAEGSSITGPGTLTINPIDPGYLHWDGGDIDLAGGFQIVGSGHLTIAGVGTGTMTYAGDALNVEGTINAAQTLELAGTDGADAWSGAVALTGDLTNAGTIVVGTISLEGHTLTNTGTIVLPDDGRNANIDAGDAGSGTFDNQAAGTIEVGANAEFYTDEIDMTQAGTLVIDGSFHQQYGTLSIEVGSSMTGPGSFSTYMVNLVEWHGGTFDLDGGAAVRGGPLVIDGVGSGTLVLQQDASVEGTVNEDQALVLPGEYYDGISLTGDLVNDGSITMGSVGAASMQIDHAGHTLTNNGTFAATEGSTLVFGGSFVNSVTGSVTVHEGTTFGVWPGGGRAFRNEGTMVVDGSMGVNHGFVTTGTASGTGNVAFESLTEATGTGDFLLDIHLDEGSLAPGVPLGAVGTINVGDYDHEGALYVDLGGAEPGEYDQVVSSGHVELDYAASVTYAIVDGYEPELCDSFDVIVGESVAGTFYWFSGTGLDEDLQLNRVYGADRLTLVVVPVGTPETDTGEVCSAEPTPTAPGAPTGLAATAGDAVVALDWDAPASDGDSPITGYLVEYSSDGGTTWDTFPHSTTATSTTVTGLTNGTEYTFRVSAVNAVDSGPASPITTATPTGSTNPVPTCADLSTLQLAWVCQVYRDLLGRDVDPSGNAFWATRFDTIGPIRTAGGIMSSTTEYRQLLITDAYQRFLGRTPDPAGLDHYTDQLLTSSIERLHATFAASPEYGGTDIEWVARVYEDILGRPADASGAAYWTTRLQAGVTRYQVAHSLATSSEARTRFVEATYEHFLRRPADPAGLAHWRSQLQGGHSQRLVLAHLLASAEYQAIATTR